MDLMNLACQIMDSACDLQSLTSHFQDFVCEIHKFGARNPFQLHGFSMPDPWMWHTAPHVKSMDLICQIYALHITNP